MKLNLPKYRDQKITFNSEINRFSVQKNEDTISRKSKSSKNLYQPILDRKIINSDRSGERLIQRNPQSLVFLQKDFDWAKPIVIRKTQDDNISDSLSSDEDDVSFDDGSVSNDSTKGSPQIETNVKRTT